jgi:hypothetical protein
LKSPRGAHFTCGGMVQLERTLPCHGRDRGFDPRCSRQKENTVNARVVELYQIIRQATNELATIRKNCPHTNYEVRLYSWRPGSLLPRRICTECEEALPEITKEEHDRCIRNNHDFLTSTSGVHHEP